MVEISENQKAHNFYKNKLEKKDRGKMVAR